MIARWSPSRRFVWVYLFGSLHSWLDQCDRMVYQILPVLMNSESSCIQRPTPVSQNLVQTRSLQRVASHHKVGYLYACMCLLLFFVASVVTHLYFTRDSICSTAPYMPYTKKLEFSCPQRPALASPWARPLWMFNDCEGGSLTRGGERGCLQFGGMIT